MEDQYRITNRLVDGRYRFYVEKFKRHFLFWRKWESLFWGINYFDSSPMWWPTREEAEHRLNEYLEG